MNFEQFILVMMEHAKSRLSEETLVDRQEVLKNNGVRMVGISVRRKGEKAAPIVYMEEYYAKYCAGASIEELSEHLVGILQTEPVLHILRTQ